MIIFGINFKKKATFRFILRFDSIDIRSYYLSINRKFQFVIYANVLIL